MKKTFLILCSMIFLVSCGTSRNSVITTKKEAERRGKTTQIETSPVADNQLVRVINHAKSFEGTPYKFGGTTKKGMDCSGLIYTCYLKEDIKLPRTSKAMSEFGKKIKDREINVGDLLFFQTDKSVRKINHVGLVVEREKDKIYFIHSTTSRGVIISSLDENFWNDCFVMVRRVI